jgi:hypothetical protein
MVALLGTTLVVRNIFLVAERCVLTVLVQNAYPYRLNNEAKNVSLKIATSAVHVI